MRFSRGVPQLVLVDELAHTNAPGSRHPKRYQDALELLDAGINVYATLNVQHLESRLDVVQQISGVVVREAVPDSVLDQADEIELIDVTPDQLRKRLAEGKVYMGERAATASENFFREETLTALREMALRTTAEHVDQELRDVMRTKRIGSPWKSGQRLGVGVGPSPFSGQLIRWTRRIAAAMDAPWVAIYVETSAALDEDAKRRLTKNLSLARRSQWMIDLRVLTRLFTLLRQIPSEAACGSTYRFFGVNACFSAVRISSPIPSVSRWGSSPSTVSSGGGTLIINAG